MSPDRHTEALAGGIGAGVGTGLGVVAPPGPLTALATVATGAVSAVLAWYALGAVERRRRGSGAAP